MLQIVFFLFSGSNLPGPGSLQGSAFAGLSPAMFLLTRHQSLHVWIFLILRKTFLDHPTSLATVTHSIAWLWFTFFVWYYIFAYFHINRIWAPEKSSPFIALFGSLKKKKKKVALILMHFENVLFSTEHVHLVMHWKVLSISWQKIIESMNNGIRKIT